MDKQQFPRMHVSLYVSDILNTVSFYNLFFGQAPSKIKPGYVKYTLDSPSLIISFVENADRVQQNFGHLGFQVNSMDELRTRMSQAEKAGLKTREEVGTSCCYAVQDKFWVSDPDGVQWEVYYFHEDAEFNDLHFVESSTEACCIAAAETKVNASGGALLMADIEIPAEACCPPGSGCC